MAGYGGYLDFPRGAGVIPDEEPVAPESQVIDSRMLRDLLFPNQPDVPLIPGTNVPERDPVAAPVAPQTAPPSAVPPASPLGRTVPWMAGGGTTRDIPIQQMGNMRSLDTRETSGGPAPNMENPPPGTASWTARPDGTFPEPGRFNAPEDIARAQTLFPDEATSRASIDRSNAAIKVLDEKAAARARQEQFSGLAKPLLEILAKDQIDKTSSDSATSSAAIARIPLVVAALAKVFNQAGMTNGLIGGDPSRTTVHTDKEGNRTYSTAPPPKESYSSTDAALNAVAGKFPNWKAGMVPTSEHQRAADAEKERVAQEISAKRGESYQGEKGQQVWDTVNKVAVHMKQETILAENAKDPAHPRYILQSSPGAQQTQKESIDTPWNLHPLTKGDTRIPVDVNTLNRLDMKVTPAQLAEDAKSDHPTMALVGRKEWNDVIAPIRGVWKSYQDVSQRVQKQLGVTTPDAVFTRLETAGAQALGSSVLAADVNAQVSHAIRMLRAMGIKGNMASEQIEREIKGTTFSAGMRSDVAGRVLHNTEIQVRNLLESFTNMSDFSMQKDMGNTAETPPAPAQGGGGWSIKQRGK